MTEPKNVPAIRPEQAEFWKNLQMLIGHQINESLALLDVAAALELEAQRIRGMVLFADQQAKKQQGPGIVVPNPNLARRLNGK